MKTWDFSVGAVHQRRHAGHADMSAAIRQFRALPAGGVGMRIMNYRSGLEAGK